MAETAESNRYGWSACIARHRKPHTSNMSNITANPAPYLIDVGHRLIIGHHHLGKLSALLRVDSHDVPQQEHIVGSEVDLLSVQDDLLELSGLGETLYHLHNDNTSIYFSTTCYITQNYTHCKSVTSTLNRKKLYSINGS